MKSFFNKFAIITKVNIIFFISIFTILVYTFVQINSNYKIYKNITEVEKASNVSVVISSLIHEIQKERGLSSGYVSSNGLKFSLKLQEQIKKTDKKIIQLKSKISILKNKFFILNLDKIKDIRKRVKQKSIKIDEIIDFYSIINKEMLTFIFEIFNHSLNEKILKDSFGYLNFLYAKEYLGIQRAVTVDILARDFLRNKDNPNLMMLLTKQQIYIENFLRYAEDKTKNRYHNIEKSKEFKNCESINQKLFQINKINKFGIDPIYAFNTFTKKIDLFKNIELFLANKLINSANQLKQEAQYNFIFYSALSGSIVLFLLIIKHFTGLNIYRTIKKLDKSLNQAITSRKALVKLSNTLELKVKKRTDELEKERYFIDTVLNTQEQIVITTDGKVIKSANKAFMKFYNVKHLKEFIDIHECICETFNTDAPQGYLQINMDGKEWTQYILDNPNTHHKAMIIKDGIEYIFSVTLSEVEIDDEILEIVVFSDITQMENAKQEIERKVEEGLVEIKTLNEEVTDTQREIVSTMGAICETRSKETGNHVRRVAYYTELLALKYGMDPKEAKLLKEASPMHDIGKVAIDDNILKKPGKLTKDEFEMIKKHTQIGYDMLKTSKKAILKNAAIVAHEHHEKYDGTGYPNKLKGEEIHIYGRITAIADVFDALGSDRCYKKAWDDEKIFQLFKDERGKHFDPKLTDIFFENIDQFIQIREEYKDID